MDASVLAATDPLERTQVRATRKALLIGLASCGEAERLALEFIPMARR